MNARIIAFRLTLGNKEHPTNPIMKERSKPQDVYKNVDFLQFKICPLHCALNILWPFSGTIISVLAEHPFFGAISWLH